MKKWLFIILSSIIIFIVAYFACIIMLFNKTETYYGKVDKSKSKVWLYSKDDRYLTTLNEITEWKKAKDGDILKVQYRDNKGVILKIEPVKINDVPNDIMKRIKQ
ncbi:hypothetical protein K2V75_09580 [Staphylococcus gallinarum]|uniref:hypothetical protein n=1 Tax=Staphylococcus gallinarum TaxID=1293 RepID=UPI001E53C23A|nr:hypothetical protein [Staphylococcus gallinarum]MCD8910386.1 hypothetical protein [Staphylococcus gallinarum]